MKQVFIISFISFLFNTNLLAVTLPEALLEAYKNNPVLNAERENINISQENLNISKSEFLPTITITGTKSREDTTKLTNQSGGDATITDVDPLTKSILIEQTLYDGKGRSADLEKSEIGIDLAKAKIFKVDISEHKKLDKYFTVPKINKNIKTNFLAYPVILKSNSKFSRKDFQVYLEKNKIQTRPIFSGNILRHPAFTDLISTKNMRISI